MTVVIYFPSGTNQVFDDVVKVKDVSSSSMYLDYSHILLEREENRIAKFYVANIAGYSKQEEEKTKEG